MTDIEYDEWMSDNDAALWHIERDPLLRSTITSVWFLDSVPVRARMDAVVERMVARLPRLAQRVIDEPPGVATPRWENDPYFDPDFHYRWTRLAGRRPGVRQVLDEAQHLASRGFDKDRPLWELRVIEGLPGGRGAMVMKIHHAIADGLGLVKMLEHMVGLGPDDDETASPPQPTPPHPTTGSRRPAATRSFSRRLTTDARTGLRLGRASLRLAAELTRDPIGTTRSAGRAAESVIKVVRPTHEPLSPVMTGRSMTVRFDTFTVPMDDLRAAARSADGTINDAFVASVLAGLDLYHRELGAPCGHIRMHMPVSVRGGDTAARSDNQFVPTRMVLPLGQVDAATRLARARRFLREVRAEPALPYVGEISGAIGRLGPATSVAVIGAMMKGVDITTTNVPGPPFPVWIAGSHVDQLVAFGPLAGSAVNITLFSYDGSIHLGVSTDAAAVAEPDRLLRCLEVAFAATLALGPGIERPQPDPDRDEAGTAVR